MRRWRKWLVSALDDLIAIAEYVREQLIDNDGCFMVAPGESIAHGQLVIFDRAGYVRAAREGELGFGFAVARKGNYVRVGAP